MPSSRITQRFTMLAAICALAAISAPTVHSAYLPLDIEDASVIASKIPVSASKANHLASAIRPGPVQSSHREPGQATHREHHATTHVQSALHPTVTGVKESEQATHHEHHTTTRAQSASYPAVTGAPTSSRLPLPMPLLLALPQHLLKEQPRSAEDSGGEGSSVTPRKLGETLVLDLLNPLLLFEEIEDALSRADPQSQGLAQRGPGEHVSQVAFDAPHIGRDSKQNPVISSGEHGTGGEGVGSGMRKREGKDEGEDEDDRGVPGTIDIMSATTNSTGLQHIGSLVLAKADMSATPADPTFFLNASSTHQTQIYLLPIHPAAPKSTSSDNTDNTDSNDNDGHNHNVVVALQLPMFDPASAAMVRYCATFHPCAAQPEPLAVERCLPDYRSRAEGKSQAFAYDSPTGVVRPMWFDGDDGEPHHQDADYADADAASEELDGATGAGMFARNIGFDAEGGSVNSTAAAAAAPASHAANSTAPMSGARDVTLVFKPTAPEASTQTDVMAAAASDDADDSLALALALDSTSATSASSAVSYSGSTASQSAIAQPSAVNEAVWTMTTASSASSATSGAGSSFVSSGSSMATEANLVDSYPISMGDMQSDSTEAATTTATLPPGSVASYPASAGVSPVNAEASASPTASAGSGNSLGPIQSSSAAPPTATMSDAGGADANIAAAGPSSSSLGASSASTSSAASGTWAVSSSTPVSITGAAAAQTDASISSSAPVEGAGATPRTSATMSVSASPVFTNINAEGPVSSLASSSAAMLTPSSASTSTASTATPTASPSSLSAEAIASLIADTAFSTLAAPPTASSPATEAAMAVEDYSPPFVALADTGPGSVATGAPTPLAEDVGLVPEEWVFAPEARL